MDTDNYPERLLHKLARELKLPKLTFQIKRRAIAITGTGERHGEDVQRLPRLSEPLPKTHRKRRGFRGRIELAVGAVSLKVFGNLTANDANTPERRLFGISKL